MTDAFWNTMDTGYVANVATVVKSVADSAAAGVTAGDQPNTPTGPVDDVTYNAPPNTAMPYVEPAGLMIWFCVTGGDVSPTRLKYTPLPPVQYTTPVAFAAATERMLPVPDAAHVDARATTPLGSRRKIAFCVLDDTEVVDTAAW